MIMLTIFKNLMFSKLPSFEELCLEGPSKAHFIKGIYRYLNTISTNLFPKYKYMLKWKDSLGCTPEHDDWEEIWSSTNKTYICIIYKENQYNPPVV